MEGVSQVHLHRASRHLEAPWESGHHAQDITQTHTSSSLPWQDARGGQQPWPGGAAVQQQQGRKEEKNHLVFGEGGMGGSWKRLGPAHTQESLQSRVGIGAVILLGEQPQPSSESPPKSGTRSVLYGLMQGAGQLGKGLCLGDLWPLTDTQRLLCASMVPGTGQQPPLIALPTVFQPLLSLYIVMRLNRLSGAHPELPLISLAAGMAQQQ